MTAISNVTRLVTRVAPVALLFASFPACAGITFCSEFPAATVFVAIAYPQDSGTWLSRGWLELSQGDCSAFDTALHVSSFYYRGVSNPYRKNGRRVIETWGDDRKFAVWDDDNFQYYNAEERVLKSKLASFSLGAEKMGENADVTVTFKDGGTTITVR